MPSLILCLTLVILGIWECDTALTFISTTSLIGRQGIMDFRLNCTLNYQPDEEPLSQIHRMRILKFESNSRFDTIVEMDSDWSSPQANGDVETSVVIGSNGPISLEAIWPLATNTTAGQYACDVMGYTPGGHGVLQKSSQIFIDAEGPLGLFELFEELQKSNNKLDTALRDIFKLRQEMDELKTDHSTIADSMNDTNQDVMKILADILRNKENFREMRANQTKLFDQFINSRVNDTRFSQTEFMELIQLTVTPLLDSLLRNLTESSSPRGEDVLERIRNQTDISDCGDIHNDVNDTSSKSYRNPKWPQGSYALLMPESDCPADDGVQWRQGFVVHRRNSSNLNVTSASTHVKHPITSNWWVRSDTIPVIIQTFCSVPQASRRGRPWPAGSYCVTRYRSSPCPAGFQTGHIIWDESISKRNSDFQGRYHPVPRYRYSNTRTMIRYCCRFDRSPSIPMVLPTKKPFYLYRHGGTCQQVHGMSVTSEYMLFETGENSIVRGKFTPDVSTPLPDIELELCYYSPN